MIKWWNNKTIDTASRSWKPSLAPVSKQAIATSSWFTANKQIHSLHSNDPESVVIKTPKEVVRSCKVKLNPSKEQRQQLNQWWHHYRFTYNRTVEAIIDDVFDANENNYKVISNLMVNDNQVSLELGSELEPNRNLKVSLTPNKKPPKLTSKITVSKKTGKVSLRLKVTYDPVDKPIQLAIGFQYPEAKHKYVYRDNLVTAEAVRSQPWFPNCPDILETNKYLRHGAVQQALSAYKTVCTNAKNNGTKGSLRSMFSKKKHESWSMSLSRSCVSKVTATTGKGKVVDALSICPRILKTPIKAFEKFSLTCDPKIHKDKWNDYWLIVPKKIVPKEVVIKKESIAIDSGEKTFLTGYSNDGSISEAGGNCRDVFLEVMKQISKYQSLLDKNKFHGRTKKYVKERVAKLWRRLVNLKNDMHYKIINDLIARNDLIILGKFNVKSILQSSTIAKSVKKVLQQQGHYQFKQRLLDKAEEKSVAVKVWSEWGTTKGCPCCGFRNEVKGRTFDCSNCNYSADRDAKAACCIMIKYRAGVW